MVEALDWTLASVDEISRYRSQPRTSPATERVLGNPYLIGMRGLPVTREIGHRNINDGVDLHFKLGFVSAEKYQLCPLVKFSNPR